MRGRDLVGKYKLGRRLSSDSSGTVYLAKDTTAPPLHALVEVKELAPALVADTRFLQRYRASASSLMQLDHPNCGKVLDFLEVGGGAFVVSEHLEGRTLREVLGSTALRPAQALALLRGSLVGLDAAHSAGLLHRSLRPESVTVQPDGLVKLSGFDQPAYAGGAAPPEAASAGISPYAYIAPDQVVGVEADVRTDVYLAGILGFELLAGEPPFISQDPSELMSMHVTQDPPDLTALRPEITAPVADIVNRALAKAPDDRQQSAREFIGQIDAATASLGVEWTEAMTVSGLGVAASVAGLAAVGVETSKGGAAGGAAAGGGARLGRRSRVLVPGVAALTLALSTAAYGYSQRWLGVGAGTNAGQNSTARSTSPAQGANHGQHTQGSRHQGAQPPDQALKPPGAEVSPPADVLPAQPVPATVLAPPAIQLLSTLPPPVVPPVPTNQVESPPAPPATAQVAPVSAPGPAGGGESEGSSTDQGDQNQDGDDHGDGQASQNGHGQDGDGHDQGDAEEGDPD
jgi:serine/threonine-protein kinase